MLIYVTVRDGTFYRQANTAHKEDGREVEEKYARLEQGKSRPNGGLCTAGSYE